MNLACSPQVRNDPLVPSFYGRTLSRTVPAVCTGPPCQDSHVMVPNINTFKNKGFFLRQISHFLAWFFCSSIETPVLWFIKAGLCILIPFPIYSFTIIFTVRILKSAVICMFLGLPDPDPFSWSSWPPQKGLWQKRLNLKSLAADFPKLRRRDYLMRMVSIMHKDQF